MMPLTRTLIAAPNPSRERRMGYVLDWIGGAALAVLFIAWSLAT